MRYEDFCRQAEKRERKPKLINEAIARNFMYEYLGFASKPFFSWNIESHIEYLLYEYFSIKGTETEVDFIKLLNLYNFDYSMSIHNALYYLLATDKEKDTSVDPVSWPGVYGIMSQDSKYTLETILGTIEVYKASEVLKDSKSFHIFDNPLMGRCHERSYDFLRENHDYQVVLSYMPNFFYGGHYHSYLEKENITLDIASNALYRSPESASKILCGKIITKLTYKQVEQKFKQIRSLVPNINHNQKLLTLALHYDQKKDKKR